MANRQRTFKKYRSSRSSNLASTIAVLDRSIADNRKIADKMINYVNARCLLHDVSDIEYLFGRVR